MREGLQKDYHETSLNLITDSVFIFNETQKDIPYRVKQSPKQHLYKNILKQNN